MSLNDQDQTRLALASLTACVVQTLDGGLEAFAPRFVTNLEAAYASLKDAGMDVKVLETLGWTREFFRPNKFDRP